jgi:acyl-CoA reductase-like NAD-dependent aldehyde dehydrogenase
MKQRFKNLIAGAWRDSGHSIDNINPSDTSDVIGHYAVASQADVDEAIDAARSAQRAWFALTPQERADRLDAVGAEIAARRDELARQLSREEGKTVRESQAEVTKAAQLFKFFAGEAVRMWGEHVSSIRAGIDVDVERRPVGVVALVTPWNFPISIPAWKAAPALAYGNAVILKPSELTNASAWSLAEILHRHLPAGVFQLTMGNGATGRALVAHEGVDAVSFTGSVETGRKISAAVRPAARLQLEMGGKNPLIIMDDADLAKAADCALKSAFYSTGQRCTAASRLIVHRKVYDRFVGTMLDALTKLRVGNALDDGTDIGPLVSGPQLERVQKYVDIGRAEGAELAYGGEVIEAPTQGFFMRPALFTRSAARHRINREEIFGPVAAVIEVGDIDEAIDVANDTDFGLSAGLFTNSLAHAYRFRRRIEAGMAMINLPTVGTDYHVPFGGTRASSQGPKELGSAAREFYTTTVTVYTTV